MKPIITGSGDWEKWPRFQKSIKLSKRWSINLSFNGQIYLIAIELIPLFSLVIWEKRLRAR